MWQDLPGLSAPHISACWKQANTGGSESLRARPPLLYSLSACAIRTLALSSHILSLLSLAAARAFSPYSLAFSGSSSSRWQRPSSWNSHVLSSEVCTSGILCSQLQEGSVKWDAIKLYTVHLALFLLSLLYHLHSQYYSYTMSCNVIAIVCMERHTQP